jgi:hypothetical protein
MIACWYRIVEAVGRGSVVCVIGFVIFRQVNCPTVRQGSREIKMSGHCAVAEDMPAVVYVLRFTKIDSCLLPFNP